MLAHAFFIIAKLRIFKILLNNNSPTLLDYAKLYIQQDKESLFNAKLINTEFVESKPFGYNPSFKINSKGLLALEKHGSYSNYLNFTNNINYENQNVNQKQKQLEQEIQRLTLELSKAQLKDIPINAVDRKTIIFWQIATAVFAAATLMLSISKCTQ